MLCPGARWSSVHLRVRFYPGRAGPSLPHLSWQIPHVRLVQDAGTQPIQPEEVTESSYSNTYIYMTVRWLKDIFDLYTSDQANDALHLLFLNGPNIHASVNFLETCWDRRIVRIMPPPNLSPISDL